MPRQNTIQFSLKNSERELLERLANDGESPGITAKRIVLAVLSEDIDLPKPKPEPEPLSLDSLGDRLSALESRLSALEGDKQETAIMIQKRHSPAPVIPEITYSHEQAANEWQRTTATVKRWASKPEKWPQGWLFDADKQFWVRTA